MRAATAKAPDERRIIRPQPGPQERFLASSADIAIYGGSAGGGKTYALLMEPTRHLANGEFSAVIFRREATQITNEGGLWDEALKLYPQLGGRPVQTPRPLFRWPSGGRVAFAHLNRVDDVLAWQGGQVPLIGWDELTHFERSQFFYMLSRNRSTSGVRPYMRATTNPDPESWVAEFIAWWIDQETGYAIPERSGVLRYFVRGGDDRLEWGDSREELMERCPGADAIDIKSVTFIAASVFDNPALLTADPGYLANLKALIRVERERLLHGNWKIKPAAGLYFQRGEVTMLDAVPTDVVRWARGWDLAATEKTEANDDPDYTAGVRLGLRGNGRVVVADVQRCRKKADDVRKLVRSIAETDPKGTVIRMVQDPGQAGKDQAGSYAGLLLGFPVFFRTASGDKVTRAEPFASAWQAGRVDVVRGPWNDPFFAELEAFPEVKHDDQADAASEAFFALPRVAAPPDYSKGGVRPQRVDP